MTPLYRKITLRIVPFLMLLYMVAFLDRVNISFAALTMNHDLGISDSLYGFAAGVFFVGYCLFEVPANLMLERVGARRWLGLLMVVWGMVSVGTAFVDSRTEYIVARCLLGVAEAGFFPGVIFYLTLWLPRPARSRLMALFLLSLPICNSVGSPISSHILLLNGLAGLRGWQWLFILEAIPAILLGVLTWIVLADGPATAGWLSQAEKDALAIELGAGEPAGHAAGRRMGSHVARDSVVYLALQIGIYGLNFWMPKMLAAQGVAAADTGWWAMLPYGSGAVALVLVGRATGRWWLIGLYLASAAGFAGAALSHGLAGTVIAFCVATMSMYAATPLFWSASTARMSNKAAGAAIATVNSIGVTGGFAGPYAMGWLRDATHSYSAGLWAIAAALAAGALIARAGPAKAKAAQAP
jgi:ACS family tartrate transporter-like MFS transporter